MQQQQQQDNEIHIVIDNESDEDPTQPTDYETYKYDDSVSTFDGYTNNVGESSIEDTDSNIKDE